MNPRQGLMMIPVVIAIVATFIGLCTLLGVKELWAGFLFITCWALIDQMNPAHYARCALGAATGAAIGSLPVLLAPVLGAQAAPIAMVVVILAAVYVQMIGKLLIVVNPTTMIFLTVSTIPAIAKATPPAGLFAGIAAGAGFFGGLTLIGKLIESRRKPA